MGPEKSKEKMLYYNGIPICNIGVFSDDAIDILRKRNYDNEEVFVSTLLKTIQELSQTYKVERILKSGNRTIVFWGDGSKTVVKRAEDEEDNLYNAFCAALAKRVYRSNSKLIKMIHDKVEYQTKYGTFSAKEYEDYIYEEE